MKLFSILAPEKPPPETRPGFVREIEDISGVRVIRLQGSVGKDVGAGAAAADAEAAREGVFARPLLFDFQGTTGWDSATVAYIVLALRRRMPAGAKVGIINAPPQLLGDIEIDRLRDLIKVYPSEKEALAALSGSGPSPSGTQPPR
jgi:hypothetical protein